MRYIEVSCSHDAIVHLNKVDNSKEYLTKDTLEKVLLSCLGLYNAGVTDDNSAIMETAQFINYGVSYAGVDYFGNDVQTQVRVCEEMDMIIPKSELYLGDLIYYADIEYSNKDEVTDVAVYFGYNTVLCIDEDGRVVCKEPVDSKYHCFYADLNPIMPYDYN